MVTQYIHDLPFFDYDPVHLAVLVRPIVLLVVGGGTIGSVVSNEIEIKFGTIVLQLIPTE